MLIQIVRFETELNETAFLEVARDRGPAFREVPGLLQKYFVKFDTPGQYGGVYLWETRDAMQSYRASALAQTVGEAYRVIGETEVESAEVLIPLWDRKPSASS